LTALLLVWAGAATILWGQYRGAEHQAFADSSNLARAFGENIGRVADSIDQTLLLVRDAYRRDGVRLDLRGWAASRSLLKGLGVQIAISDASGIVVLSSLGSIDQPVSVADREHFRVQAASTTDALYISKPVVGRISRQTTVQFVRKLIAPDGGFGGIVVVSVDPYSLSRFYQTLSIGSGAITLINLDGVILARAPAAEDSVGRGLPAANMARMRDGPASGSFAVVSPIDGIPLICGYRRLDDYPLMMLVGLSEADVFAAFRFNRIVTIAGALLLSVGIVATGLIIIRQRARLLGSREALSVTLENMNHGIQMIAPDGGIRVMNSRAVELLGIPPHLLAGEPNVRTLLDWQLANGELGPPETWTGGLAEAMASGGGAPANQVYERTRPNGTVLEVVTRPMADGGAVRTFTDITERKRNEAALAAARDAAEDTGKARTEFLAAMSHEIRTPMNSIIGFTALLLDMPLSPTALQYIDIIRRSGDHLLRLINDILDLSKLDAGHLQLQHAAFDLHAELHHAIELMANQARDKALSLDVDIGDSVPRRVQGDSGRLRQILLNLIGNAIKFTAAGGVRVTLTAKPDAADPAMARLSCCVADTGIGIPADKLESLFKHFVQIDPARHAGGTGLGLAISKRLVEQMGGSIGVRTEPGRGSTFYFDLPLRMIEALPVPDREAGGGFGYRVLLADDNDSNRAVIARMLESRGHQVDSVSDGQMALEAASSLDYDLVVMDLLMPGMDGLAATAAIRRLPGRRGRVPIIGLTANARPGEEETCFRAGMNAFLTKPVSADELSITIGDVVPKVSADA
jgi:signal transduction histidine kinase